MEIIYFQHAFDIFISKSRYRSDNEQIVGMIAKEDEYVVIFAFRAVHQMKTSFSER